MAKRSKTTSQVADQAAVLLQKLVRMKAAAPDGLAECVTCGRVQHWKEMDGGHFISRTYKYHKLREENVHPQCKRCNRFLTQVHDDYHRYMVDMYGADYVEWLSQTKWQIVKFDRHELLEYISDLKAQIKFQESRLM